MRLWQEGQAATLDRHVDERDPRVHRHPGVQRRERQVVVPNGGYLVVRMLGERLAAPHAQRHAGQLLGDRADPGVAGEVAQGFVLPPRALGLHECRATAAHAGRLAVPLDGVQRGFSVSRYFLGGEQARDMREAVLPERGDESLRDCVGLGLGCRVGHVTRPIISRHGARVSRHGARSFLDMVRVWRKLNNRACNKSSCTKVQLSTASAWARLRACRHRLKVASADGACSYLSRILSPRLRIRPEHAKVQRTDLGQPIIGYDEALTVRRCTKLGHPCPAPTPGSQHIRDGLKIRCDRPSRETPPL